MGSFSDRKNVSTRSAAAFAFIVKSCVIMRIKNYIARSIEDPIGGVCVTIIE